MICKLLGHKRDRHRAWYDGVSYRAPCHRCGIDMVKEHRHGWHVFDPHTDPHAAYRSLKP